MLKAWFGFINKTVVDARQQMWRVSGGYWVGIEPTANMWKLQPLHTGHVAYLKVPLGLLFSQGYWRCRLVPSDMSSSTDNGIILSKLYLVLIRCSCLQWPRTFELTHLVIEVNLVECDVYRECGGVVVWSQRWLLIWLISDHEGQVKLSLQRHRQREVWVCAGSAGHSGSLRRGSSLFLVQHSVPETQQKEKADPLNPHIL